MSAPARTLADQSRRARPRRGGRCSWGSSTPPRTRSPTAAWPRRWRRAWSWRARCWPTGADLIDIGGESGVTNRPPVVRRGGDRARGAADRGGGGRSRRARLRGHLQARGGPGGDRRRRRDRQRRQRPARSRAGRRLRRDRRRAGAHAHHRPAQDQATTTRASTGGSSPRCERFLAERIELAVSRGVAFEQLMVDPGPDFSKTPAQTVAVLRALPALHELGRPILLAVSRKDFVGALTRRPPRARLAGTLAAMAHGVAGGRTRAARPRRRRRGRLPRRRDRARQATGEVDSGLRVSDTLRWDQSAVRPGSALDSGLRIAGRWPNATGAHRSSSQRSPNVSSRSQCPGSKPSRRPSRDRVRAVHRRLPPPAARRAHRRHPQQAGGRRRRRRGGEAGRRARQEQPPSPPEPQEPQGAPSRRAAASRAEPRAPSPRPSPRPRLTAEAESDDDEDEEPRGPRDAADGGAAGDARRRATKPTAGRRTADGGRGRGRGGLRF